MIWRADVDRAGLLAVTGSDDKTLRLWALEGDLSAPLETLRVPAGPSNVGRLYAVAMAPAGDLVAAGGPAGGLPEQGIVYLFNRDGQIVQRVSGLPSAVTELAFSPSGRWLAAGLGADKGIRIYDRDAGWAETARDTRYADYVLGLAFAPDDRLAATSLDGQVRLYDARFRLVASRRMTQGYRPYGIAFHPDGGRLAVGFEDSIALTLLDGRNLEPLPAQPDLSGIDNGNVLEVAWSRDGARLYAAGRYNKDGRRPVFAWTDAGTSARRVIYRGALATVMSLKALPDGVLLVAASDPHLAVIGKESVVHSSPKFDPRGQRSNLAISLDGLQVDFGFNYGGDSDRYRFDVAALRLAPLPGADGHTSPPRQTGLPIAGWDDADQPTLDGKPLSVNRYERSRSLAIQFDAQRFVLGTNWCVRAFDATRKRLWHSPAPGAVWAVNISGDGRLVVAAYADGTIRWHRMDDGRELLAFFPMIDRKNWVAWTPEGVYAATPGAHGVLRWHINHGWDQLAEAIPVSEIPEQRRPEVLPLVLQEMDLVKALGLVELNKIRAAVAQRLKSGVAPGAQLHVLAIGVGEYNVESAKHLRLDYADNDAWDLASALLNTQGSMYAKVNAQVLRNKEATETGILRALKSLKAQMQPGSGDLAVIHFSGHGALVDGQLFLLPHDIDAGDSVGIKAGGIEVGDLKGELIQLAERGRVLLLLDACHSGATTNDGTDIRVDARLLRNQLAMANVTVLTSSSGTETSREDPKWGNGAFTEVLLEALGRAADTDKNGLISMHELTGYISTRVPQLTEGKQTPGIEERFTETVFAAGL